MAIIDSDHYVNLRETAGPLLAEPAYSATSSDDAIASIGTGAEGEIAVVGESDGDFTITVTRASDGATATISDAVGVMDATFTVIFGDVHPKG